MTTRSERVVSVVPGATGDRQAVAGVSPVVMRPTGPVLHWRTAVVGESEPGDRPKRARFSLVHRLGVLGRRDVQVVLIVVSVLLLLSSNIHAIPNPATAGNSGFATDSSPVSANLSTFYPYVVNPSLYPSTSQILSGGTGGVNHAALTSTVIQNVPSYSLVFDSASTGGRSLLQYESAGYNATVAEGILNGTSTAHEPLVWSTPVTIANLTSAIDSDSVVAAPSGTPILAAVSTGGHSYLYDSWNFGGNWTQIATSSGESSAIAIDPTVDSAVLTTSGSSGIIVTSTQLGSGSASTTTIAGDFTNSAATFSPNMDSGTEGVLAAAANGSISFYTSSDLGRTFVQHTLGTTTVSATSTVFDAVGGTLLTSPGETVGQVTATVDGNEVFAAYTASFDGQTVLITDVSPDGGTTWEPDEMTQLPHGAIIDPQAVSSPSGDVYVTALDNAVGAWEVDQMEFGADGRVLGVPTALPGSRTPSSTSLEQPSIAVDAFQRPLVVWSQAVSGGVPSLSGTGAFLSPTSVFQVERQAFDNLTTTDFKPSGNENIKGAPPGWGPDGNPFQPLGGTFKAQEGNFASNVSLANSELPLNSNCPLSCFQTEVASSICGATNPNPVTFLSSATISGANLNGAEHPDSNLAQVVGPMAASTYMGIYCEWALEAAAAPVSYASDPLAQSLPAPVEVHSHSFAISTSIDLTAPAIDAPDGSALYAFVGYEIPSNGGTTPTTVYDSVGNSYTLVATADGGDHNEELWVANNIRGSAELSITAEFPSGAGNGGSIDVIDLVGAAAQSTDQWTTATGDSSTASTTTTSTHSMDLMLLGVVGRAVTYPITPSAGQTTVDSYSGTGGPGTDGVGFVTESALEPMAGAITLSASIGTSTYWSAIGVGVIPLSSPPPPLAVEGNVWSSGSGPTVTAALSADPAGSTILVFTGYTNSQNGGGSVSSVSDSQSDSFTKIATADDQSSRNEDAWITDAATGSTSGTTISVTFGGGSGGSQGGTIEAVDVVGAMGTPVDIYSTNYNTNSEYPWLSLRTTHAGDLVIVGLAGNSLLSPAKGTNGATSLSSGSATVGPYSEKVASGGFYSPTSYAGLVNLSFQIGATTDWAGIAVALSPSGLVNQQDLTTSSNPLAPPPTRTFSETGTVLGDSASASVTVATMDPTTAELQDSALFPIEVILNEHQIQCGTGHSGPIYRTWDNQSETYDYWWSVTFESTRENFSSSADLGAGWDVVSPVYLTNLTPDSELPWSTGDFWVDYQNSAVYENGCTGGHSSSVTGYSSYSLPGISGTVNTTLAIIPGSPFITATTARDPNRQNVSISWSNSMPAQGEASVTGNESQFSSSWNLRDQFAFVNLRNNYTYTASIDTTSQTGIWNSSQVPSVNANLYSDANPLSASYSCSFQLQPNPVSIQNLKIIDNETSRATVTWNASVLGPSWVFYEELGTGVTLQQSAAEVQSTQSSAWPYQYYASLQGLSTLAIYIISVVTTGPAQQSCLTYAATESRAFDTGNGFVLTEVDQPYDSITQTGGGANLYFQVPSGANSTDYAGGYLTYWNNTASSNTVVEVYTSLSTLQNSGGTYDIPLDLNPPNTSYTARLVLNYTIHYWNPWNASEEVLSTSAMSQNLTFTYLQDSSGDGLTNIEKVNGWRVTYTTKSGATASPVVTANPALYSTNGLVSDYVEKDYGLNPNLVDTAGSHMLDTWNLTFNLGAIGVGLPANGFEYWYQNTTYDPFPGKISVPSQSNISASPAGGIWSGDGSPWASTVEWSSSALTTFEDMPGVQSAGWLRATSGEFNGDRTITVWGKLSLGANPLAQSTPNDGIIDGSRINATWVMGLSLTVTDLYVGHLANQGEGFAAQIQVFNGSTATGKPELTNYSEACNLNGNNPIHRLTNYTVILPVNQTSQFDTLQFEVVANESASGPLTSVPFDGANEYVDFTYSMARGASVSEYWTYNSSSVVNGTLSVVMQAVPMGAKAPTFLWVPTAYGTTNGLPSGLERYTGEESFALVLLNSSQGFTSVSIPNPDGASYTLKLQAGLNDFLVPREQFLNSTFAAAVLEGRNFTETYPSNLPTPPVLGNDSTAQGVLTSSFRDPGDLLADLEAYWQNRSIWTGPGTFSAAETGVTTSSSRVQNVVASGTLVNNTGGLAAFESAYGGTNPPALEDLTTITIKSQATFDLFLSAILTNTTAGVNGSFQNVTSHFRSLAFSPSVSNATANSVIVSSGLYGPPGYNVQPPSEGGPWGDLCNAVSAIVTTVTGAVESVISIVWTATLSAANYLAQVAREAAAFGASLLNATVSALESVGRAILAALESFLDLLVLLIQAALNAVFSPLKAAFTNYAEGVDSAVDPTTGQEVLESIGAPLFLAFYVAALLAEVVIVIALSIGGIEIGPLITGAIVGVIISLLSAVIPTASTTLTSTLVTDTENWAGTCANQNSLSAEWSSWSSAFNYFAQGPTDDVAATQVLIAWGNPESSQFASLAVALLALVMDWFSDESGGPVATVSAAVLAMISLSLDVKSDGTPGVKEVSQLKAIDGIILGIDGFAFVWAATEFTQEL
jgi:hypothetical protein